MRNKWHFRLSRLGNIAAPFGTDGHAGSCLDLHIRIDVQFPVGVTHCALARHGGDERRDVPRFLLNVALEEFGLVRLPRHAQQYVESEYEIFLKTIIPSRKFTKIYFGDKA